MGGNHVKMLATGVAEPRRFDSGPDLTPARMVKRVLASTGDWSYEAVSIGYPGRVVDGRIALEPRNLGRGWTRFDFARALKRPVRILNDAAMQALGGYRGGSLLFLGLGTGLGTAMIVGNQLVPMEVAHLPYRKGRSYEAYVGDAGRRRLGTRRWRKHVARVIDLLSTALQADEVLLGGGNVARLERLPSGARRGSNADAFTGGFRLWDDRSA